MQHPINTTLALAIAATLGGTGLVSIALIDERMQGGNEGSDTPAMVTMSRQDLEKLRELIRDGEDGAMRAAADRD